ncbi:MAG: crosslink repair DNA glycosylase YcaQ family protein, partial [Serratia proteamaculans]
MNTPVISLTAARALHLAAQGLLSPMKRKAKPDDVVAAIGRMGLLQIDTISVVARSPYLVLFSRLGDYQPEWLEQALASRRLFEYWAHEACFLPIEDFGLLRHRMLQPQGMGWKYSEAWMQEHQVAIDALLQHIETGGPVRSADFSAEKKGNSGWWDWKPEKRHLEILFTAGKLMVAERRNFHRVYDLTERLLPHWDDSRDVLSVDDARQEMLRRSCRFLGIFRAEWLADYYRLKRVAPKALLTSLQQQGEVLPVRIDGLDGEFYVHHSLAAELQLAEQGALKSRVTTLLSPFDPVVWDRRRALELFNFDYRLECY